MSNLAVPGTRASVRRNCPLCRSADVVEVLAIQRAPLQIGIAWPTREEALGAAVGDTAMAVCGACGFLFNAAFEQSRVRYAHGYDVALTHSDLYRAYLEAEARLLVDEHRIRDRRVLEIGCGDGYFLRRLCALGHNEGLGLDPSLPGDSAEPTLTLLARHFEPGCGTFDVVVVRSVLELIPDPVAFLHDVRAALAEGGLCYIEVPNAAWVLDHHMAWNVHHEHCSSFTVDTLRRACDAASLEALDISPCFEDGQYLRAVAVRRAQARVVDAATDFAARYASLVGSWRDRLVAARRAGGRIVVWGAGGRGASFLAAVDADADLVEVAVDINPARQGSFLPVTGHPIVAPDGAHLGSATIVVVTNSAYLAEITRAAHQRGFRGEVWAL